MPTWFDYPDETNGQPDFLLNTWVTDNEDKLVELTLEVQEKILVLMAEFVDEDETVEHWVQRVKGKWSQRKGTKKRPEA